MKSDFPVRTLLIAMLAIVLYGQRCTPPPPKIRTAEIQNPKPPSGDIPFSEIELRTQDGEEDSHYLGHAEKSFRAQDIEAELLVVHVFSLYCTLCQQDAPNVNMFYKTLGEKNLNDRIKMIGIAVKDSRSEADLFKKKFRLGYPVFPDEDMTIAFSLNVQKTPTLVSLIKNQQGSWETIDFREGALHETDSFLELLMSRLSDLKEKREHGHKKPASHDRRSR